MVEYICQYYQSDRNTAILASIIGMIFLIGRFTLFKLYTPHQLIKGLGCIFIDRRSILSHSWCVGYNTQLS